MYDLDEFFKILEEINSNYIRVTNRITDCNMPFEEDWNDASYKQQGILKDAYSTVLKCIEVLPIKKESQERFLTVCKNKHKSFFPSEGNDDILV